MDNPNSPLDTLRQLKEMLDAGAITPTEFDVLKQRLVFAAPVAPAAPAVPAVPPAPAAFDRPPVGPAPDVPLAEAVPAPASFPAAEPEPEPAWRTRDEFPPLPEEPARNPLALVFAIGGVLAFLAVVLYLNLSQSPSEHLSSTSLTAADSLAAPIETGPQAAPLPTSVAAPETVRIAPTNPAPVMPPRPAPPRPDSAETTSPTALDSAARQ